MSNYILTRKEAAEELDISVRSVDRYIKSGKLRSKKKGKTVYVHQDDILNINGGGTTTKKQVIITEEEQETTKKQEKKHKNKIEETIPVIKENNGLIKKSDFDKITKTFETVYTDLRNQIDKKDQIIQELSVKVGISQEQVNQSISVSEHNRSQMLLEESKANIAKQMNYLTEEKIEIEKDLKNEKFDKKVLIFFVFILLGLAAYFWYKSIK